MVRKNDSKPLASNRKALRNYEVLEKYEAGIVLQGTEVKSVRAGNIDLSAGFALIEGGEVTLRNVHIKQYVFGHQSNHDPRRARRLLLHKKEIHKLLGKLTGKGLTLVPLSCYLSRRGLIKIQLGLCRGRLAGDKRELLRRKAADEETRRAIAQHRSAR